MITAHKLSLKLGPQEIFHTISFSLAEQQRIGLIGRNGSGKSTLLKVISGLQAIDSGSINIANGKRIAYIPQELVLESERTVLQETFRAWADITQIQDTLQVLQSYDLSADLVRAQEYAQACDSLAQLNPERALAQTKALLQNLGFSNAQFEQPVQALSVGWKMRLVLAKQLLSNADFYLFDEPTNHLDLQTKDWFISFLQRAPFGFLLVCHERYILDKLCTTILSLEHRQATHYQGNYSDYEKQYQADLTQLRQAKELQEKEIARKKATIARFRASASKAKMAQNMLKELEKIEIIEVPPSPKQIHFSFPVQVRSGKQALIVRNVGHQFGTNQIFQNVSFEIQREQKVALIAPNGAGKSTLLSLIMGKNQLQQGTITFGYHVTPSFFEQDQAQSLKKDLSILDNILENGSKSEQVVRSLLGSFLFSHDTVYKKVGVLSGGEKNRVGMVKLLLQDANFLILDEPTNHLDIISKEILIRALQAYQGTLLFVSHDHSFINALATHTLELTIDSAIMYEGNYQEYQAYKKQRLPDTHIINKTNTAPHISSNKKNSHRTTQELKKLEQLIEKWEQEINRISNSFAQLTYATPSFIEAQKNLAHAREQLENVTNRWELLYNESLSS